MRCKNCGMKIHKHDEVCANCSKLTASEELQDHPFAEQNQGDKRSRFSRVFHLRRVLLIAGIGIAVLGIILVSFLVINKFNEKKYTPEESKILMQMQGDSFSAESTIEVEMQKKVRIDIISANNGAAVVMVTAPDISDKMVEYINLQNEFSEKNFEEEVLRLLTETKTITSSFELTYETSDNLYHIQYTEEYSNAVSCGLLDFYHRMTNDVTGEMEKAI